MGDGEEKTLQLNGQHEKRVGGRMWGKIRNDVGGNVTLELCKCYKMIRIMERWKSCGAKRDFQ